MNNLNLTAKQTTMSYLDDQGFEQIFKTHYKALFAYAGVLLRDEETAEEIVQNMFMKLWEKRALITQQTSVKAYLYKSVHNDCLNFIKHQATKLKYQNYAIHTMDMLNEPASARVELSELELKIRTVLNDLPEQCRTIFQLSRFEELKYREIADQLGLSIKTVENQMSKALKILRLKLVDFITLYTLTIPAVIMYYKEFFK